MSGGTLHKQIMDDLAQSFHPLQILLAGIMGVVGGVISYSIAMGTTPSQGAIMAVLVGGLLGVLVFQRMRLQLFAGDIKGLDRFLRVMDLETEEKEFLLIYKDYLRDGKKPTYSDMAVYMGTTPQQIDNMVKSLNEKYGKGTKAQ